MPNILTCKEIVTQLIIIVIFGLPLSKPNGKFLVTCVFTSNHGAHPATLFQE